MAFGYKFNTGSNNTYVLSDDVVPAYPVAVLTAVWKSDHSTQTFTFATSGFSTFTYMYFYNGEFDSSSGPRGVTYIPPSAVKPTISVGSGTCSVTWGQNYGTNWEVNTLTVVILGV